MTSEATSEAMQISQSISNWLILSRWHTNPKTTSRRERGHPSRISPTKEGRSNFFELH